jgi:hypothetical protein
VDVVKWLVIAAVIGCRVPDLDVSGKTCPCPGGYACVANACVADDGTHDAGPGDGDASASCIAAPKTALVYQTATFAELSTGWTTLGGSWARSETGLHQTSETETLAVELLSTNPGDAASTDYRVVATATQVDGAVGGAIEVAARGSLTGKTMYHCNLEPNDGNLLIDRTNDGGAGAVGLVEMAIEGVEPKAHYTLEIQVEGDRIECCVRGLVGASLATHDATLATGLPGVKTYLMSADFVDFAVYQ